MSFRKMIPVLFCTGTILLCGGELPKSFQFSKNRRDLILRLCFKGSIGVLRFLRLCILCRRGKKRQSAKYYR